MEKLDKGICCERCGQCSLIEKRHTVICQCGHIEVKEKAYVRTICEYGVLKNGQDIDKQGLKKLINQGNNRYLKYILNKHFTLMNAGPNSRYVNHGEIMEYWFSEKEEYFNKLERRLKWSEKN